MTAIQGDQGGGSSAVTQLTDPSAITRVHVIFKTHLDLGFTDFAAAVAKRYFDTFIPQALDVADALRGTSSDTGFVWTTGSWLLYEYLERADADARTRAEEAIRRGTLSWHALPFTTHTEFMDASLFRYSLRLSQRLDQRFGRTTIAAKMTDVPGHTRGMVPLLAAAGVRYLHLGVNPFSAAPAVPDLFRWRAPCGAEIVVQYHKADYGITSGIPGTDTAVSFAHTGDNQGPQSPEQVQQAFERLRAMFPNALLRAADLNAVAEDTLAIADNLPVVTGELGDTWIHGVGTAPWKTAAFRALSRLRVRWQTENRLDEEANPGHDRFSRTLLCIPEHTWGMSRATLNDYEHNDKAALATLRATEICQRVEASWQEQRDYITQAVACLDGDPLQTEAEAELATLTPVEAAFDGPAVDCSTRFENDQLAFHIDPDTGAIHELAHLAIGRRWAMPGHRLGLFRYEVFSQQRCERFLQQYGQNLRKTAGWGPISFARPDFDPDGTIRDQSWTPTLTAVRAQTENNDVRVLAEATMAEKAVAQFGCPARVTIEYRLPAGAARLDITLQWFGRAACRLPDAIWFGFAPKAMQYSGWRIDKMGDAVDPYDVVDHGNRRLHCTQGGVRYADGAGSLSIESLDAALVAPGRPRLYDFSNDWPQMQHGVHFNLWNNQWNTNFPYWSEDDGKFRFVLRFE